jgi:Na+-transporting NADH:ubiquinone oxidoreductase subunit NqrB
MTQAGALWRRIDPRFIQIATLSCLLMLAILRLDSGASAAQACITILCAVGTQLLLGARRDWRSAVITGLSLSILLRANDPLVWAAAAALGVGSKFFLRIGGKQIFNPACFAIVAMLLGSNEAWVSPGQWGALAWAAAALASAAALVLTRAGRTDTAAAFLGTYALLLAVRCQWLGDPWTIPLHQIQSGSLLIFAFFMITDPRSTPNAAAGRVVFAVAVAVLAYVLQFDWQVRPGLFYALFIVSPLTPVLDRVLRSSRFIWHERAEA